MKDIFSKEFINSAESIEKESSNEYTLFIGEHQVTYEKYIRGYKAAISVRVDGVFHLKDVDLEEKHRNAFEYIIAAEFDLRENNIESAEESVNEWLNVDI